MEIIEQRMRVRAVPVAPSSTDPTKVSKATLLAVRTHIRQLRGMDPRPFNEATAAALIALLFATLATSACAQPSPVQPSTDLARIMDLIGPAACADDNQCRVIGIGALPCGGPERYLPWSVSATEETALRASAARYAEARRRYYENIGLSSTCVVQPEPGVRCDRSRADAPGRCVLIPVAPGRPLIR